MQIFLVCIGVFWIFVLFLDLMFKSCMFHPYLSALYTAGMDIQPFVIFWKITRFNRFINRMGLYHPSFLKAWFRVGAFITSIIIFPCLLLYLFKLLSLFKTDSSEDFDNSKLIPVIPGYNFPISQWKLYGCILLVCSVIHEFGHALAASRQGISVDNFGFALCLVIPVAFVSLRYDQLKYSSKWEQMSIFCAGIWHNIVLSLSCLFILKYFVLLVSPLFYTGAGVAVLHVNEQSSLSNPAAGFASGDIIIALGNHTVKDLDSWNSHLQKIEETSEGLCIPRQLLVKMSEDTIAEKCFEQPGHLYFNRKCDQDEIGACIHGRTAIKSYRFCKTSSECDESSLCVLPLLPEFHKFVVIERQGKPQVLFAGLVSELHTDVKVSEFLPRWKFLSTEIAEAIKEFFQYILIFSNGLACLNVLPLFKLDGKFIMESLIHILLQNHFSLQQRKWIIQCISTFAFVVASSFVVVTLYKITEFYM